MSGDESRWVRPAPRCGERDGGSGGGGVTGEVRWGGGVDRLGGTGGVAGGQIRHMREVESKKKVIQLYRIITRR